MPSPTLIGQALVAGVLLGGLYGLMALGLTLSWGILSVVNIAYLGLTFLAAYITYDLGTAHGIAPWLVAICILPPFFLFGVALHAILVRFRVSHLTSLLVTFGLLVAIESLIQFIWTADFRRYELAYSTQSMRLGPIFVPIFDFCAFIAAAMLSILTWAGLRYTYAGRALRAVSADATIATAFGINVRLLGLLLAGLCAALAAIGGVFIALVSTLSPSQMWSWFGVVFAVVIIGRLGNPLGALIAGIGIGVSESLTMAIISPVWSPLVAFSILIVLLIWQPKWL
ncbi:branched-chain amino acid ABC transporter permease [Bradyrhizobium sp. SSUT18]|uniref:branched-chain amino acid ABC transporter permease n=1 Tax=Bradyrhizobium sp. SSUT18 TaxID=3040602 RepID=UPI002448E987|nr:branched-chain amino acid ABC transporter permease [Bradyrhizobium sp. SSUT18]MDH2401822.1 branched-chain amino acid ABC transporter permease [Bradyrhizobium sp. SSUT18]